MLIYNDNYYAVKFNQNLWNSFRLDTTRTAQTKISMEIFLIACMGKKV